MGLESKKRIHVRVVKHLPMGLGVETEYGQTGLVRVREIAWDAEHASNWKQAFPVGWSGSAYPLRTRKGQVKEFSLRLAESDPWEDFTATLVKGKIYEGVVTGIVSYGTFIEISSGITGLLHRSRLPA